MNKDTILVIDPGSMKTGVAVLDGEGNVIEKKVCVNQELLEYLQKIEETYHFRAHLIGNKGAGKQIGHQIKSYFSAEWLEVDEHKSSEEGKILYWQANQKGWKKLVPKTFLIPTEPWDDWAAVVIGRRWLAKNRPPETNNPN